jgi:hypothetical protein
MQHEVMKPEVGKRGYYLKDIPSQLGLAGTIRVRIARRCLAGIGGQCACI